MNAGNLKRIEKRGRVWWAQEFHREDGGLAMVRLYDADGLLVAEADTKDEIREFMEGTK